MSRTTDGIWPIVGPIRFGGKDLYVQLEVYPDELARRTTFPDTRPCSVETLDALFEIPAGATVDLADPTGYGRIVRDAQGNVTGWAMDVYMATMGRGKIGFSRTKAPGGEGSEPVGGLRGLMERNLMRVSLSSGRRAKKDVRWSSVGRSTRQLVT